MVLLKFIIEEVVNDESSMIYCFLSNCFTCMNIHLVAYAVNHLLPDDQPQQQQQQQPPFMDNNNNSLLCPDLELLSQGG